MTSPISRDRYDVVIAGARCAGASTAMLLARQGLRVLVVDPLRYGSDTLSTHALMRGAVLQLHRWGVLDKVREAGTPPIPTTTFHYRDETIVVPIKARDGVDALYAPRRTVLDALLADAAEGAGAEVVHGLAVGDLVRNSDGRVCGAEVMGSDRSATRVEADLVIGADGIRSRVARILDAEIDYTVPHTSASIYGYTKDLGLEGYHWYYDTGASVGAIPTNDDNTCVFASLPPDRFAEARRQGLDTVYQGLLEDVSTDLAERVAARERDGKLRAFAGTPGFLRRAVGPGWALVGDAGYFRDPITAHGITDALRDAELLARAVTRGGDEALEAYQATRNRIVRGLLDVTDRISSFEWEMDEVKEDHLQLSKEMKSLVEFLSSFDEAPVDTTGSPMRA